MFYTCQNYDRMKLVLYYEILKILLENPGKH